MTYLTRILSALGNVPWIPIPSRRPLAEESLDSSSAKLLYEFARDMRVGRLTWGSDVRSHDPASSSESDAVEANESLGGKIRSLMLLCRHRGVGMESYILMTQKIETHGDSSTYQIWCPRWS